MTRLIRWNPSGANNTEQGRIKTQFLEKKLTQCKDIDFACIVETHNTSEIVYLEGLRIKVLRNQPIKTVIGMMMHDFHGLKTKTFLCVEGIAYF